MPVIRTLLPWEVWKLRDHLLRLDAEDRRMRFGHALGEAVIDEFLRHIDWLRERIFVVSDDEGMVIGAVHAARLPDGGAELAFSVEPNDRRRGIGSALCRRAMLWARNRGLRRVLVYCLAENIPMRRLAIRCGMRVTCDAADCEAILDLEPATPSSVLVEMLDEGVGVSAVMLVAQRRCLTPWRLPVLSLAA